MNSKETFLARILFKNKIYYSDGKEFESLFTQIMNYYEKDFQQVKPWGNIGDRKNDGYIPTKGIFYQVFAPEDIRTSNSEVISKLKKDFAGLLRHWSPVNEFYFVVNDKFYGVSAEANQTISDLVSANKLTAGKILTAKDLENLLFSLSDDQIFSIIGFFPNLNQFGNFDFSALNQVIAHLAKLPLDTGTENIKLPDWDRKIEFNKLSPATKNYLNFGNQQLGVLNNYLDNEPFLCTGSAENRILTVENNVES
ncbi:MAG: hypothetical protein H3C46_03385, partial [Ignavibacteria bacterium]|nr:hypothetical protein [Ignavibacteria bacterium]